VTALTGASRLTTVKGISSTDEVVVVVLFLPVSEEDKFAKRNICAGFGKEIWKLTRQPASQSR
jgi:hypothetical protein